MTMDLKPTLTDFEEARKALAGLIHRTPMFTSRSLSEKTGLKVWLKGENFQKTGSFKPRGVFNKVLHLSDSERRSGIITTSAGNCGQAVAYVAAHQKIPGYVVMPAGANRSKVSAVKEYGAEAILPWSRNTRSHPFSVWVFLIFSLAESESPAVSIFI